MTFWLLGQIQNMLARLLRLYTKSLLSNTSGQWVTFLEFKCLAVHPPFDFVKANMPLIFWNMHTWLTASHVIPWCVQVIYLQLIRMVPFLILHYTEALWGLFNISHSLVRSSHLLSTSLVSLCILQINPTSVLAKECFDTSKAHYLKDLFLNQQNGLVWRATLMPIGRVISLIESQ